MTETTGSSASRESVGKKSAGKPATKRTVRTTKKIARSKPRRLRVRQIRSGIGHAARFRRTLRALGLKHHQDEIVVPDNPSIRGMLTQVHHLVRVSPEEA